MLLGFVGVFYVGSGIPIFNELVLWQRQPAAAPTEFVERMNAASKIGLNPFWAYEADNAQADYILVTRKGLTSENVALMERLVAYRPCPGSLLRLALLRAYAGRQSEAEDLLLVALAGHPLAVPSSYDAISELKDPAVKPLQALAKHANDIYNADGPEAVVPWVVMLQQQRGRILQSH